MTGPRVWMALIRLRHRMKAADRLVQARHAQAERYRRQAFGSPPMTPEEVRQHEEAVAAVRRRDEQGNRG
jgi:hypothetical protein